MLKGLTKNRFLVVGRAGMDFYADPPGTQADQAKQFFASLGGSAGNIAVGIAKLGGSASLLTAVSDDSVGRFTLNQLDEFGVDRQHVATVGDGLRTSLAVVETRLEDFQSVIYRNGAADFALSVDQSEAVDYSAYGGLIFTGTGLAADPSRAATMRAIELAKASGVTVIFDIDYRPYSWASAEEATQVSKDAAAQCDVIVGNDEEFGVLAGSMAEGEAYAANLAQTSAELVVYKRGPDGSRTFTKTEMLDQGIFSVKALKPVGAGDGFMAGFVTSLASGKPVEDSVIRGAATAAIVVSGIGCSSAMPATEELEAFLDANPTPLTTKRTYDAHPTV